VEGDTAPSALLGLMRFIGHWDSLRWAFGTWVIKTTCTLVVCDLPLCSTKFRGGPARGSHFDPQLLGSWDVMNIINGIARGDLPYALVPPSLAPANMLCAKCTQMCSILGKEFRA